MFKVALNLFLLTTVLCIHWQSHGNFSQQNITYIRNTIDDALLKAGVSFPAKQIAKYLSDSFNSIWSTAWNVIVIGLHDNHQGSVAHYGYSYSDHWYKLSNYGRKHQTFILWKDYHCQIWVDFNSNNSPLNESGSLNPYVLTPVISSTADLLETAQTIYQDSLFIASNMVFVAEGLFRNQQSLFQSIVILGEPSSISSRFCTTQQDTQQQYKYITRFPKKKPQQTLSYLIFRSK